MTDLQTEKAFQKQDGVFLSSKKLLAKKTSTGVRFYKKIGLGKSISLESGQVWVECARGSGPQTRPCRDSPASGCN